ncbi:MAG: glycosyltransferase family 4 protein [Candidatus Acidiferrales bacterium]
MKILIAIGVKRQKEAGAAGVVFNHAEELQKLGHRVDTWFFDDLLPSPRWPARFQELEFAFAVSRHIRKNPSAYDVVNLHAPWGGVYGLSRKLFSTAAPPPYVFTMQGSEERYVRAMRVEQKKGRASHFALRNRVWHRLYHQTMYDLAIKTADFGNVANREGWILSELKYGHPPGRVRYIPNGTNPEFLQPHSFVDSDALRLLYVGTWLDRKGVFYLVESFARLAPSLPKLSLTVAGCAVSEEQIRAYFSAALHPRVHVLPFLNRGAMPNLYATHDIFVLPSLVEGMPLTLLEAMASAMPVVTTNTCGMADVVENGVNGLLVAPADARAIEGAVLLLAADPVLRQRLGQAAQLSMKRYTWERSAEMLESLFRQAIAREGSASA